jgi:hypothetical protein
VKVMHLQWSVRVRKGKIRNRIAQPERLVGRTPSVHRRQVLEGCGHTQLA